MSENLSKATQLLHKRAKAFCYIASFCFSLSLSPFFFLPLGGGRCREQAELLKKERAGRKVRMAAGESLDMNLMALSTVPPKLDSVFT